MDKITELQKQYIYYTDLLKDFEGKEKPGNDKGVNIGISFAILKIKEKIAELDKIFDDIDYAAQITFD